MNKKGNQNKFDEASFNYEFIKRHLVVKDPPKKKKVIDIIEISQNNTVLKIANTTMKYKFDSISINEIKQVESGITLMFT